MTEPTTRQWNNTSGGIDDAVSQQFAVSTSTQSIRRRRRVGSQDPGRDRRGNIQNVVSGEKSKTRATDEFQGGVIYE